MKTIFKQFKSIEEIKAKGEFIKKGKIVPVRIARTTPRRNRHLLVTGSNQWSIPTRKGHLIFVDNKDGDFNFVIKAPLRKVHLIKTKAEKVNVKGSPYTLEGVTHWLGNNKLSESEFLESFNRLYLNMNGNKDD